MIVGISVGLVAGIVIGGFIFVYANKVYQRRKYMKINDLSDD